MNDLQNHARRVLIALGWSAASALLTGCSNSTSDPTIAAASIQVSPASLDLTAGATGQLSATVRSATGQVLSGRSVSWSSSDATVATVSSEGLVSAAGVGTARVTAASGGAEGDAVISVMPAAPVGEAVEIHPAVTYQTMLGWEATSQIGQVECNRAQFNQLRDQLIDRGVNELGLNRLRLEMRSGTENPVDTFSPFYNGQATAASWRAGWYQIVNDNADPFTINPAGFQFAALDVDVEQLVLPMRTRLAARGEQLYVNLNYVDFAQSPFEHSQNPEEYAELMLATFQHLKTKYNWVPDAIEISLEPDNTPNWRPSTIGQAIVATGDRLKAAGFTPEFIAPSTTNASTAVTWIDALVAIPRVTEYLTEFAYHRYSGVSESVVQDIGDRAAAYQKRSAMLEHIGSDYNDLYEDLTLGRNSAWQQFGYGYCGTTDDGGMYFLFDPANLANPTVQLTSRARFLRQYFLFVRRGAVRIGATSGTGRLKPLAFRNANGKTVVVIIATQAGAFTVRGLPAGVFGIKYTTSAQYNVDATDVSVAAAQPLAATIPAAGVITVYQR